MAQVIALVLVLVAVPASAQTWGAWPESKRPIAEWLSNAAIYSQIGIDTVFSVRSEDRSAAIKCQLVRYGVLFGGVEVLKRAVGKPRPDGSDNHSWPSGHTGGAAMASGWRYQVGIPVAAAVGVFRVGANKHDLVDVLSGMGLGLLASRLCSGA